MRVPYLPSWDNTPIVVTMTGNGIDENGATEVLATHEGKCCYVNKVTTTRGKDGQLVTFGGLVTIRGDIAPAIPFITGSAAVEGQTRVIVQSEKVRNPDGSVNHTRLGLL